MSERVQRVRFLIEIGTVAIHQRILMTEDHIALQNLCVRYTCLVEMEILRLLQINHRLQQYED